MAWELRSCRDHGLGGEALLRLLACPPPPPPLWVGGAPTIGRK